MGHDLYRCRTDFGFYRSQVTADDERDARRIVENDHQRRLNERFEDLAMDLRGGASCELVEEGDWEKGENVEGGFVYKEVRR